MSTRITFLVNGLGLGNSTRCHAIIEELHGRGCTVDVVTSGNGAWYFDGRAEVARVHPLEPLFYASEAGRISVLGTARGARRLWELHRANDRAIASVLEARRPDVVVTDSLYNAEPVRRAGLPFVAINNSDVTVQGYRACVAPPASIRAHFYAVELLDFAFHRLVPTRVISPTLDPLVPEVGAPFVRVGPIVRRGYEPAMRTGPAERVVVMLSGSAFATDMTLRAAPREGLRIDFVGRSPRADAAPPPGVHFHGKIRDPLPLLREADVVVVNGGFSAVSEVFCLRKPVVVVPVAGHAEQWLNAKAVASLGLGLMADESSWEAAMLEVLAHIDRHRAAAARLPACAHGAAEAADAILAVVERR